MKKILQEPTLYETEIRETKEKEKFDEMVRILGRSHQLPKNFQSTQVNTPLDNPEIVLKKAGYKNINRGWIRKIEGGRYHAYPYEHTIYFHKDMNVNGKHKSIVSKLNVEKKRLQKYRTTPPPTPKKEKITIPNLSEILKEVEEKNRNLIKKNNTLTGKIKRAIKSLL